MPEYHKESISKGISKWKKTDIGESTNTNLVSRDSEEDFALPPIMNDSSYYQEDGDVWSIV
jgi:hypothetical protein